MKAINHVAVVVVVILHQIIGFLWYSPSLFFDPWVEAFRLNLSAFDQLDPTPFLFSLLASFSYCYFFAWLISRLSITSIGAGVWLSIMLWIVFVGFRTAAHYLFAQIPWTGIFIEIGAILINFLVAGVILTAWRPKQKAPRPS